MLPDESHDIKQLDDWDCDQLGKNNVVNALIQAVSSMNWVERYGIRKAGHEKESNPGIEPTEQGDLNVQTRLSCTLCGMRFKLVDKLTNFGNKDICLKNQRIYDSAM